MTTATGHHYSVQTIQKALQLSIDCGSSLRGVQKSFKFDVFNEEVSTPSWSSVRNWLGRVGLYELQRQPESRNDWVFIIDLTVEVGHQKCLVVLGVTQEYLETHVLAEKRGLKHHEVQVLALEIMESTRGELIEQKLSQVTALVGKPFQIIADRGADLQKGIKLYQQKHPDVIYSYDVTHAMALLLKHELVHCAKYQSFLKHCCQCRNQLQQTELSFLSPPSSRNKCRYFNVERLVNWAEKLFNCQVDTLAKLVPNLAPESLIKKLCWKFGWLIDYQEELQIWSQMIQMTRTVETQLKNHGIDRYSLSHLNFMNAADWNNSCVDFRQHIVNYLATEIAQIPVGKTLLATSDVIESIFGKYKQFSPKCPIRQLGQMVLRISLSTMNLTHSVVKKALETVGYKELQSWSFQVFGQSMLGKRKTVFALDNNDTEYV